MKVLFLRVVFPDLVGILDKSSYGAGLAAADGDALVRREENLRRQSHSSANVDWSRTVAKKGGESRRVRLLVIFVHPLFSPLAWCNFVGSGLRRIPREKWN